MSYCKLLLRVQQRQLPFVSVGELHYDTNSRSFEVLMPTLKENTQKRTTPIVIILNLIGQFLVSVKNIHGV